MTEQELQNKCCSLCECASVDYMHIPNEHGTADRRAIGMRKGVPDLILIDKNVLFVELKRNEKLKPSKEQDEFMSTLKKHGVLSRLVGSERQFHLALRQVAKERRGVRAGVPLDFSLSYSNYKSPQEKVHRFFMDRQGDFEPNELFAIKLFNKQNNKFPWLCNIREHYFVATKVSTVTSKLLMAGWDVVLI